MGVFLGSNIRHLRKQEGLTQEQFANRIGVKRSLIGAYEDGRTEPKLNTILTIAQSFKKSLDQLLTEDLSEGKSGNTVGVDWSGKSLRVLTVPVSEDETERCTLVHQKASAGYMNGYGDVDFIDKLPAFSLPFPEVPQHKTTRVFQIKGDSMLPVQPDSYIIGEYIQDWKSIKNDKAYILVTREEGIVYKRVILNESAATLTLKSDNPAYQPYTLPLDGLVEIWKSIGVVSFHPDEVSHTTDSEAVKNALLELTKEIQELKKRMN